MFPTTGEGEEGRPKSGKRSELTVRATLKTPQEESFGLHAARIA